MTRVCEQHEWCVAVRGEASHDFAASSPYISTDYRWLCKSASSAEVNAFATILSNLSTSLRAYSRRCFTTTSYRECHPTRVCAEPMNGHHERRGGGTQRQQLSPTLQHLGAASKRSQRHPPLTELARFDLSNMRFI